MIRIVFLDAVPVPVLRISSSVGCPFFVLFYLSGDSPTAALAYADV